MRIILVQLGLILLNISNAQKGQIQKPKLVIGIVVDQMRYDYLYRFEKKYGAGGFKRLLSDGFLFKNCHYNYVPTYTGPGHASIYTGCSPAVHGIISNVWYDKESAANVYCTNDNSCLTVGANGNAGQMSPQRMLTTTIGDELRVNSVKKSRVYAVALKDRSSILPAGHSANAAFWFDEQNGKWISSSFYYKDPKLFPQWLTEYNLKSDENFLSAIKSDWKTFLPINEYTESFTDNNRYEIPFKGESAPVFPHRLSEIQKVTGTFGVIKATPFGNTITKDFAKKIIENEKLGKSDNTDMLCISFSSTDYVGHQFGPSSIEMEDTYIRLDKDLEEFLNYLDSYLGKGNYLIFLTADHGATEVPSYLKEFNIPGGYVNEKIIGNELDSLIANRYGELSDGEKYVVSYSNQQVFFNVPLLERKFIHLASVKELARNYLLTYPEVEEVYDENDLKFETMPSSSAKLIQNGFHHKRSGHLVVNYFPGVIEYEEKGTTHGSPYSYDTHVPLIFYGTGIKKGESETFAEITQIAPTVCSLLKIPSPNGTFAHIIEFK